VDATLENSRATRGLPALTPSPSDERWSFFKSETRGDLGDDLSNASTHSIERVSLPCRTRSIKRVSWESTLCTEAGRLFYNPQEPVSTSPLHPSPPAASASPLKSCCRPPRDYSDSSPSPVVGLRKGIVGRYA